MAERIYTIKSGLKPEPMEAPAQPATVGAAGGVGDVASYNANTAGVPTANVAEVASAGQTAGRVYRKKSSLTAGTAGQAGQSASIPTATSKRTYTPKMSVSANKVKYQTQLVRDWFEEAEEVISSTQDYVKANENKWNKTYAAEYTDSVKKLLQSAGDIATYFEHYKEDEEAYTALNEAYTEFQNYLANFDVYAKEMRDFYGKWGSEKEYKEADAAQREFEAYLKEDEGALKNEIKLYSDLLEMVDEYRLWESRDDPRGSNFTYNVAEVKSQLQALSGKLNYYGFAPYDAYGNPLNPEQELKKKKAAAEEKLRNVEDTKTLNRVNGYIEEGKNSGEFEKYVKKGESIKNPTYMKAMTPVKIFGWTPLGDGETVNNPVTYTLANRDKILLSSITAKGDESVDGLVQAVFFMTEEQVDNYNYLIAKHGRATADDYLELVRKEVKADQTERIFTKYLKGKKYKELAFSAIHGIDQFATGISSVMGSDYADTRVLDPQAVGSLVREDLSTVGDGVDVFGSSLGQVAYDFGVTTSNMVPSIAAGAVANVVVPGSGAFVTPALMGLSSGGNAYREALAMGYTKEQAREYGFLVGTSEALLEKVLGTLGPAGNSVVGNGIKNAVSGIKNGGLRFAVKLSLGALGNAAEEFLQEILTPAFENIALDADNTWSDIDWQMAGYSAVMGALSAGLMDGAVTPTTSVMAQHVRKNAQYRSLGKTFIDGVDGATIDKAIAIGMDNAKGTDARIAAEKISEKVKAGKKVSSYAVGRMVAESQTEQAQISRAIERTVLSTAKEWNIPTDAAETVSAAAVSLGQKVEFVSPEGMHNRYMAGEYDSATDTVRLNAAERNVDKLIGAVLAHEMVHTAEGTDQLQKLSQIAERMENHKNGADAWEKLQADVKSKYAAAGKQLSDPEVKREALAYWIAENLFQNKAFAKAVVDGDANVGNAFFYMIDRVRRAMGAKKASAGNLAMLERLFMQALDNRTLGPREGDVQGAIRYTVDNKPVVVISEDILMGVTPDQYLDVAEEIIKTRFPNGIPVSGRLVKVNKLTRDEYTHSKNTRFYKSNDGTVYADKMRAAGQLDEIVLASTNYINEDLNHARKDKFVQFARGDVLMRVGNHDYSAKVVIGFTSGNNMVLYDVVDFTPATQPFAIKKETDTRSPSTQRNAKDSSNVSASNTNVAQNSTDVNTQSMQEGAGISTQGALLSPESMEAVRNGTWREARAEGVDPNADVEGNNPSVTADAVPPPFTQGRHAADAANGADLSIDEAAVLESAVRSQLQGKQRVAVDTSSAEGIKDVNPYLDKLVAELGPQEVLRRMWNAAQMERPTGTVVIDGKRVDAGAYMDAYERSLPKDKATLERHIERLQEQRTEEMVKLEQEGALEDYHFGGLKIDLQLFAATRKWDLLQLDAGEDGTEVRQFYEKRLRGTDAIHNQELIDLLAGQSETYNPIANEKTLEKANSLLRDSRKQEKLLKRITAYKARDMFNAVEMAAAQVMIKDAINDGELGAAHDLIIGLSRKGTEAGRAVQALSMMARLTPEGTLKAAIKTVKADADYAICEGANKGLDVLADDIARAIKEAEGKGLTSDEIANRIRKGVVGKDAPVQFDHVPQNLADQVSEATGADVTGYTIVVSAEAMQVIVDGGANVETLVDTDAETLQIIVRDGTDTGTIETAAAQQPIKGKKRLPAKLTREELVQLLSEDLAAEKGNFFTQEEIYDLLWKTVNEAADVPEQLKRYVLKKIRKDDGSLAQRIYELHKRGDLKQIKLRRAMEEALELPTLTDEDLSWIVKQGAKIESLQDKPVEQADAMEELYDYLGAKLTVTGLDKWQAWRKFGMLFNPKTHIRNFVSNLTYMGVRNVDSAVATALERTLMKFGVLKPEQRAAAFGWHMTNHGRQIMETIKARVPEAVLEMQKRGTKYEQGTGQLKQHRKMHGKRKVGEALNTADGWNSDLLEGADILFFKPAYINALGQIMTARKATEITDEMHATAMQRALEATFRNRNMLSEWLSHPKRGLNSTNRAKRFAAYLYDVAIPFVNTPAAVAEQTALHSPIGIIKGAVDFCNAVWGKGSKDAANAINTFAKGITGSALMALGWFLASRGWLRIHYGETEKERAADEIAGLQENSIVIGDVSISIDWLQPVAAPLILGGAIAEAIDDEEGGGVEAVLGVAAAGADSLFTLTMLQSFYDIVGGYNAGASASLGSVAENLISQSVPTLLGQIARSLDPVQRKVNDGTLKGSLINPILAKIPWASKTLDPELDVWGNEVYRTGYASDAAKGMNVLQQFVSPANFKRGTGKDDPISEEILRLYADQGGAVIPTAVTRDEAAEMGEDYVDVNRLLGGTNRLAVEEFVGNKKAYEVMVETGELTEKGNPRTKKETKYYRDMTDDERRKVLSRIYKATKAELTGDTEGKTESQLTDSERYIRELLRRVREGERGTNDTVDEQAQQQPEQPKQEDTSYYEDLLRRMRNGY